MSGRFLALSMAKPPCLPTRHRLVSQSQSSAAHIRSVPWKIWNLSRAGVGEFQILGLTFDLSPTDGTEACQGMGRSSPATECFLISLKERFNGDKSNVSHGK